MKPPYKDAVFDVTLEGMSSVVKILTGLAILLAILCALILTARRLRPVLAARRVARQQAKLEGWIAQLKQGPGEEERRQAVKQIVASGPAAMAAALDATTTVEANGLTTSKPVNQALAEAGPQFLPVLLESLEGEKVDRRTAAACVLREMGPAAEPAVSPLVKRLTDANLWVRELACEILGNVGSHAATAVDPLLALAKSDTPFVRRRAVLALGKIGPPAKAALPTLRKIQKDEPQNDLVQAAETALFQIDPDGMAKQALAKASPEIRALVKKLSASDPFEAIAAAKELAGKGPDARAAIPSLAQALANKNKWIREAAAGALGKLGHDARTVRPALEQAANDLEVDVRDAVQKALRAIGEP